MEEIRSQIEDVRPYQELTQAEELKVPQMKSRKKMYMCELCNVKVTSNAVLQKHFEGKKHQTRMERQGKSFKCEICNVEANSQSQLEAHLQSAKHRTRVQKKEKAHQTMNRVAWLNILAVLCLFLAFLALFKYI